MSTIGTRPLPAAAPGVNIRSTIAVNDTAYAFYSGTSMVNLRRSRGLGKERR